MGIIDWIKASRAVHRIEHSAMGLVEAHRRVTPGSIKRFSDLRDLTVSGAGAATITIDNNSPFGGPAMKLVCTTAGAVDLDLTALTVAQFDDHLAVSAWLDDATTVSSVSVIYGTTGFARYQQYNHTIFSGGILLNGHRVFVGGPLYTPAVNTFVHGTDALNAVRFRISFARVGGTVWLKDVFIPARQTPLIAFTWDDGEHAWETLLRPALDAAGIKATFAINSASITGSFTAADIQALKASGHQVTAHNVNNYKLQTLYSHGNGESNGDGTSVDAAGYAAEYYTCRNTLLAIAGTDPEDFCYHSWVQGGVDAAGIAAMAANGIELARIASGAGAEPYGFARGNGAYGLSVVDVRSTTTVAVMKSAIDAAITYGGLLVFMGHGVVASGAIGLQVNIGDWQEVFAYAAAKQGARAAEVLTMRQLRDRLRELGDLDRPSTNPAPPVQCIGRRLDADFNSPADQGITLLPGSWQITQVFAAKGSRSMNVAQGGVYTGLGKSGPIVGASQAYTALAGLTTDVQTCTMAATPTVSGTGTTGATVYFSLTTGQGAAGTADIFIFGRRV